MELVAQYVIPALVSGLIVLIGLLVGRALQKAQTVKAKAEAEEISTRTYLALIKPLEERVNQLEKEVKDLKGKLRAWLRGWKILRTQMRKHKIRPAWNPSEDGLNGG